MSGKRITMQQVRLYMNSKSQGATQAQAGAKAGVSERSARRIDGGGIGVLEAKGRDWRTRKDPFAGVWESEVVALLERQPGLDATTLFEDLQDRHPGRFGNGVKRTFQRRVKAWKALYGADKEVMFRQVQEPGRQGLSDFTELKDIAVTIAGVPLEHRLYHFRLAYSGWSYVKVVLGGESFSALAEGLQEALWRLGGAPAEHRTDSLSAAYKNLSREAQDDLTERYEALCAHYGMTATRNNRGVSHENGAEESPHGHLKRRRTQALLLRESADFASLEDYRQWLDALVGRFNRRASDALAIERGRLQALPARRTTDYSEQVVAVTTSGTIEVKRVLYSVPARLIGERLRLHIFDDRIEAFVGATRAITLPRVSTVNQERARCIDYRHLIAALVRKPQAFRYSQLREDLLPNATYRAIWQHLDSHLEARAACKRIVGILALAARADCEQALGAYLLERIAAGEIPSLPALEQRFEPGRTGGTDREALQGGSTRYRSTAACCPPTASRGGFTDMLQTATLPLMLKQLRLSSVARHWQGMLATAERNGWDSAQYLSALCERELAERHSRRIARYTKDSHLPTAKSLASFDFAQVPGLPRARIEALAGSSDWTRQARNVLLFGASGVGKTHLAAAIGHGLAEQSVRVRYCVTTALVQDLQLARQHLRLEEALHKLDKYPALILDDFGYVKKNEQETQVLFELIAHRYETGSLIITSNQPFAEWDRIFPDQMMTVAAVDRLVHHATIIEVSSDSYRRKEALGHIVGRTPTATTTPAPATTTAPVSGGQSGDVRPDTPSG